MNTQMNTEINEQNNVQMNAQQQTYIRRLHLWLWLAFLAFVLSFLFLASDWRFMLVSPPGWTLVKDAYPMPMPHEAVLQFFIEIWHGLIGRMGEKGLLDPDAARSIIVEGFPIATAWRLAAFVCLVVALWQAVRLSKLSAVSHQETEHINNEKTRRLQLLSQAELTVNNLLLDPAAHEFSEDLQQVSRQIKGAADGL
jgi:hypothetical protein